MRNENERIARKGNNYNTFIMENVKYASVPEIVK